MNKPLRKALAQIALIVFLSFAALLMREFTQSGMGRQKGLAWAVSDVFTGVNLAIAVGAAIIGYLIIEFIWKKL